MRLSVTFHIVDLWHYDRCCIRPGVIQCTLSMVLYLDRISGLGYTRCSGHTSVHLCAASLQTISQDFYSPISSSVKRSWWPRIRWCGTRGIQEQGQCLFIGLAARSLFCPILVSLSLLSFYGLVLYGWGLRTDRVLIALSQPCTVSFL